MGVSPAILQEPFLALFEEFGVTMADGTRFLGMDMVREPGVLTFHMGTYVRETVTRFEACDVSSCFPYREIVGCLLWACGCCHGADLMRVKALASKCNDFTGADFAAAMKVLKRKEVFYVDRKHRRAQHTHCSGGACEVGLERESGRYHWMCVGLFVVYFI